MLKTLAKKGRDIMLQNLKNNIKNNKNYFSKGAVISALVLVALAIGIYAVSQRKVVTVAVDNKSIKLVSYKSTVKDILEQNKIALDSKDKVRPGLSTKVQNGQNIYIKRAVKVNVQVDGKNLKIKSAEATVGKMLKAEKISLSSVDKVKPSTSEAVKDGLNVAITRVNCQTVTELQPIAFQTSVQKDDNMGNDQQQVVQNGVNGSKEVSTKVTYEDGKEVSRNIVSEIVKSQPVQAIIKVGTLGVVKSNRGDRVLYKTKVTARATAYTDSLSFGITASGTRVKRDTNGFSSVAVDPRVIPLGTKLYIPGYGYGIAEDTGGAIKGNRVDLFFTTESECSRWGVRSVDVYIIK